MGRSAFPTDLPTASRLPVEPDLQDPLVTFDGESVGTTEAWYDRRRPEIRRLFEHYVYGHAPDPPSITTERRLSATVLDGRAALTEVTIRFVDLLADAPTIDLTLFTPLDGGEVPVFLGLNHNGNHSTVEDDAVTIADSSERFGADARGSKRDFWCVARLF